MYFGTVCARGLSLGSDGSLTVLLLLLLSLVSPATCSSPAVVYPCRSGDVQREEGDSRSSPIRSNSDASDVGLASSRARG